MIREGESDEPYLKVAVGSEPLIVGDGEHRGTGLCHAPQIGADQFGGLTLQGRGGFIDKHITFAQQTTNGQHHALALATTEFGHLLVVGLGSQMQAFHLFLQPFLRERQRTILSQLEGQSHHLTHLLIGKQRQLLGQIGHLPAEGLGRMWRKQLAVIADETAVKTRKAHTPTRPLYRPSRLH